MINNKAYINGVEVSLEFASMYHDVISKINIGVELNVDIELSEEEKDFCCMLKQQIGDVFRNGK